MSNCLTPNESNALLEEKSLWAIYKLSWKLPCPYGIILPPVLINITFLLFTLGPAANLTNTELIAFNREILDFGITYTSTTLGFLIAGFTVFATLTKPELFVKLARHSTSDSSLNWLKRIFVVFMHTFSHYVSYLMLAISIKMISQPRGICSFILHYYSTNPEHIKQYILSFSLALLSSWLFYLLLLLVRFIFNIYHTCMLTIAVTGEEL